MSPDYHFGDKQLSDIV